MKRISRSLLSLCLAFVLCAALLPVGINAAVYQVRLALF